MRKNSPIFVPLIIVVIVITATVALTSSRPSWQLSARNSAQGVIVEVYKSDANRPTYKTVLTGRTVDTETNRTSRTELPAALGKTTFHDETLRPGRWTVVIGGTEIDIMERALILDGTIEILPFEN